MSGQEVLVIGVELAAVLIVGFVFLLKLRRRTAIGRNSEQVPGVILASTMNKDGRSASSGSIATSIGDPGHHERGQTTQGAPTMRSGRAASARWNLRVRGAYEVQLLDSVAVGAKSPFYRRGSADRATSRRGYYESTPALLFEPSPWSSICRSSVPHRAARTNTGCSRGSLATRCGALSDAEFESRKPVRDLDVRRR